MVCEAHENSLLSRGDVNYILALLFQTTHSRFSEIGVLNNLSREFELKKQELVKSPCLYEKIVYSLMSYISLWWCS